MTESILEESRKAKRNNVFGFLKFFKNKKVLIPIGIILLVFLGFSLFFNSKKSVKGEVLPKEYSVRKDDLQISVESDGKVVAEQGVELSFSVSGNTLEVEDVFVQEGDKILKGDKIAQVKTDTLELSFNSAYASYQSSLAAYQENIAGPTDQEISAAQFKIEQAELSLGQARDSLEETIRNSRETVADAQKLYEENPNIENSEVVRDTYNDLVATIKSTIISMDSMLRDSDEILGIDDKYLNNDFENLLGAKDSSSLSLASNYYRVSKNKKDNLDLYSVSLNNSSSYDEIDQVAELTEDFLNSMETHLYYMQKMLSATITSADFSQSELDSFKSTITSNRSSLNSKITLLNTDIDSVVDTKDLVDNYKEDYDNAITDTNRDINDAKINVRNKEIALETYQLDYKDLIAPLTDYELASAKSSFTSASVNLEKARLALEDSVLESPIDGEVALLNYKKGDIILTDDNDPFVVILNNDTLFIEVNIEEADINKLRVGQKAYVTFDALDELKLEGQISFISLTSDTNNNGIVTYLVRVVFENTSDYQIREGMTAFIDFVISETKDVLIVPVSAVKNIDGQVSVKNINNEWVAVTTGFTDGEYVEIISGLAEGDKILY